MKSSEIYNQPSFEADASAKNSVLARELYNLGEIHQQARQLIEGHTEIRHDKWEAEPEINARTALFEALTAKGHLSKIAFEGDVNEINSKTLRRILNGWSEALPDWEKKRRFYELAEELIIHRAWQDIQTGRLPADTLVFTISDYPEEADDELAHTIGYRSLNKKGMVRATHFENINGVWARVTEQISRSNSDDNSSNKFLRGIDNSTDIYGSSLDILSNQILANRQAFPNGVVDLQAMLDGYSGPNVLYGERQDHSQLPSYSEVREISAQREAQAEQYIKQLADHERGINVLYESGVIGYDEKLAELNKIRTRIIDEICLLSPNYARDAMGQKSGELFEKAAEAMASGDHYLGSQLLTEAILAKDERASVACGGIGKEREVAQAQAAGTYAFAMESRASWQWKKGLCVIKECPTRPSKTEVGPCDVCRGCQHLFDKGLKANEIRNKYQSIPGRSSTQKVGFFEDLTGSIGSDLARFEEARKMRAKKTA